MPAAEGNPKVCPPKSGSPIPETFLATFLAQEIPGK
jgi:hypothetical protein